jgi:hypothetical protein
MHFSNGQYEKILNILSHQGNTNKTILRVHLTPVRMAIIKKTTNTDGDTGAKGTLSQYWWECKLV